MPERLRSLLHRLVSGHRARRHSGPPQYTSISALLAKFMLLSSSPILAQEHRGYWPSSSSRLSTRRAGRSRGALAVHKWSEFVGEKLFLAPTLVPRDWH